MTASRTARARLTLPPQRRLRRKADFEAVYADGRRFGDGYFSITLRSGGEAPRLGLAVSTKVAGNSVERNRIRRLIRESFRLQQHRIPAADIVVGARARVRGASAAELRASLDALWSKLEKQCAGSPKA